MSQEFDELLDKTGEYAVVYQISHPIFICKKKWQFLSVRKNNYE